MGIGSAVLARAEFAKLVEAADGFVAKHDLQSALSTSLAYSARANTAKRGMRWLAFLLLAPVAAHADDSDLDRIPQALPPASAAEQPTSPATGTDKLFLQNDFELDSIRTPIVAFPPPLPARWEERLFFDARVTYALDPHTSLVYSGRFNLRAEEGLPFPDHEDVRNDLREAYLDWQPDDATFIEVGRINLKSGVALGFNPTDFFKTRAVVEPVSVDPSVLREDRLGTLMFLGQRVWEGGAVTLAIAPKLYEPSAVYRNNDLPSFDPMFDRTNAADRVLAKVSFTLADDVAPELLTYYEGGRWHFGANLTRAVGQASVVYLEWAGGDRASLVNDALAYGKLTGTIPSVAPPVIPSSAARDFQNDVAVGASYTTDNEITFNLEYHYHQAGFSDADWENWFATGIGAPSIIGAELWYIRAYAAEQQEPLGQHTLFLRADAQDAFVKDLEISGFINEDIRDGSALAQATADYYLSQNWTVGLLGSATFGGKRSDFGSLPATASVLFTVTRYF